MKHKKLTAICAAMLALIAALSPAASAAPAQLFYPTAVTRSEDGTEIRKMYDLGPEDDPAGIPRSDFEQDGWRYTLTDLLRQELPEYESRPHTETVTLASKSKDMASVLELLPAEKEVVTEDGLTGTLYLQLDMVKVEAAGYGSSTKSLTAQRTYPSFADQDTQYIPKSVSDNGHTLTLQTIDWQPQADGSFTAVASYSGTTTSSYVKGYTVTADYAGEVSRINLDKVRYVAIFEGTDLSPAEPKPDPEPDPGPEPEPAPAPGFNWGYLLIPPGLVAAAGGGVGLALFLKRRRESEEVAE